MKLFIDYFRRQVHQLIPYLEVVFENSSPADLAIYYNFRVGPFGGGNQLLKALLVEISSRGLHVEINRISRRTPVCLINSFNFDYKWLRKQLAKQRCRVVHRVDGPINFYRGIDDGLDKKIWEINK